MTTREERQALRILGAKEREMLQVLERHETLSIMGLAQLCAALSQDVVTFVTFSCLGSIKGKEELRLDLFETYFFRSRKLRECVALLQELRAIKPVRMLTILPDCEPRRTWGWSVSQEELTTTCELMIEDARDSGRVPEGWEVVCWSALEARTQSVFPDALAWATQPAQALHIHQEAELLGRYPDILFKEGLEVAALRQVAAYAHEGRVLEELYPHAVLLQSESSPQRKDRMYQPLRSQPLAIVHPFNLS